MSKSELKIRRGSPEDAETLAPLAIEIFNDAFAANPLNKPEDMRVYISDAFSVEQTRREISETDSIFFIAEMADEMIGYAKLKERSTEDCITGENPIELQRLYVKKDFHGLGIAGELMNECFDIAREKKYQTIWLGVWEYNYRAQKFYEKLGFRQVGSHVFQLGSDAQTDLVMEKSL
jgi:ribosomal protein S18 acetylase RimI-like enzyme